MECDGWRRRNGKSQCLARESSCEILEVIAIIINDDNNNNDKSVKSYVIRYCRHIIIFRENH